MRKLWMAVVVLASLAPAGAARAEAAGDHAHEGFFLQLDVGVGAMKSQFSSGGTDESMAGGSGEASVAVGDAVVPGFAVAAQAWIVSVRAPTVKVNGAAQGYGDPDDLYQLLGALGVNLTYFFVPSDFYLSATPSLGFLSLRQGRHTLYRAGNGFALRLAAGKEWPVSEHWGIGANLQYAYARNPDTGPNPPTWTTNWFGVAFSATYN